MESHNARLIDPHNRRLNYLRISITDRCSLRCIYCMPSEGISKLTHSDILTYEEIHRLARIAVGLGIDKIRLTGGEPLLRKGICEFISSLTALPGLRETSLTTNGIFLGEKLERLKEGGITRINISLDSLKRENYRRITGFDGLETVMKAIEKAGRMGFNPVKINMVVMEGINDNEVLDFARLSLERPYHIRFIEYMPLGTPDPRHRLIHMPSSLIMKRLSSIGELIPVPKEERDGPAERFRFGGAPGEIGFISPLTHHFCSTCNRLRLTASGGLKPCLLSDAEEDLRRPMRNHASDEDLVRIFLRAAARKPCEHAPVSDSSAPFSGQMSSIGG
jgi:cyclic pyranopterin phosphate synthase